MANIPRRVAILGGARIPFARANSAYAEASNQDMLTAAFRFLVDKYSWQGEKIGEVAAGAVIKHSRDWTLAAECMLGAGIHPTTPAYDLQRACGTSLSAAAQLALRIAAGEIDSAIAGGSDSASDIPLGYGTKLQRAVLKLNYTKKFSEKIATIGSIRLKDLKPTHPGIAEPRTGMSMGQHCEEMAKVRGLSPQAFITFSETAAVDFVGMAGPKEGMLMAPAYAVPRMLDRAKLKLQDFDIYEIHEAFAAQVLCTLKAWETEDFCRTKLNRSALGTIDRKKMNPVGSSVAIGHPFAATGARIIATLAKQLAQRGSGRGLISICAAGGMGVTAILER